MKVVLMYLKCKACAQKSCKCHSDSLSCTEYCVCGSGDNCNNPFTSHTHGDYIDDNYEIEDEEEEEEDIE